MRWSRGSGDWFRKQLGRRGGDGNTGAASAGLENCRELLWRAARDGQAGMEVRAEWLRQAADWIGRLTGRIDVEEVLGAIFSEFCIGK